METGKGARVCIVEVARVGVAIDGSWVVRACPLTKSPLLEKGAGVRIDFRVGEGVGINSPGGRLRTSPLAFVGRKKTTAGTSRKTRSVTRTAVPVQNVEDLRLDCELIIAIRVRLNFLAGEFYGCHEFGGANPVDIFRFDENETWWDSFCLVGFVGEAAGRRRNSGAVVGLHRTSMLRPLYLLARFSAVSMKESRPSKN